MSKELSHFSMFRFANNDTGYVQCVIKPAYKSDFEAMGFVDHPDKLKPVVKEEVKTDKPVKRTRRTKEQMKNDH